MGNQTSIIYLLTQRMVHRRIMRRNSSFSLRCFPLHRYALLIRRLHIRVNLDHTLYSQFQRTIIKHQYYLTKNTHQI